MTARITPLPPQSPSGERLTYSVAEAAARLGVCRATLYTRIKEGQVQAFLWGGRRLIRADELERVIDAASGRTPER